MTPGNLMRMRVGTRLEEVRAAHPRFGELLDTLRRLGEVAVVGGAARDWYLVPRRDPRDIDLVVDASHADVRWAMESFGASATSHGGYSANVGVKVDAWSLENTAMFRRDPTIPRSLVGLVRSTFFNVDAVAVSLRSDIVYDCGFFRAFADRVLAINHPWNGNEEVYLARAMALPVMYGMLVGEDVHQYVMDTIEALGVTWERLCELQTKRYGRVVSRRRDGMPREWFDALGAP